MYPDLKATNTEDILNFSFSETIVAPGWLELASDGEVGHGLPGRACVGLSETSPYKTVLNPVSAEL